MERFYLEQKRHVSGGHYGKIVLCDQFQTAFCTCVLYVNSIPLNFIVNAFRSDFKLIIHQIKLIYTSLVRVRVNYAIPAILYGPTVFFFPSISKA